MFRLVSSNAQGSFRSSLLTKVRIPISVPASSPLNTSTSNNTTTNNNNFGVNNSTNNTQFTRHQSSAAVDLSARKVYQDEFLRLHSSFTAPDHETKVKLNHFKELLVTGNQKLRALNRQEARAFYSVLQSLSHMLEDAKLRRSLNVDLLHQYSLLLHSAIFSLRTNRLAEKRNRDKDEYNATSYTDEVVLRGSVLNFAQLVEAGEFKYCFTDKVLQYLLYSMFQFKFNTEALNLWENGVNDAETGSVYLRPLVLATVLPRAFELKRFTYEEILHIYELNTKKEQFPHHTLVTAMGKIAIHAGDYSRALDFLERLLEKYDQKPTGLKLASLSDLHLSFIGDCKEIAIAKHFFDKVIEDELPYKVLLKVPYVTSLLDNAYQAGDSLEEAIYFWKNSVAYYMKTRQQLNSRYSLLNNKFFELFFQAYPELNEESFAMLRDLITFYAQTKPLDETFLNTIITHYSWKLKEVLDQLMQNYEIYEVERTPVSHRICLKKTGQYADYTNEEILARWNENLKCLDNSKYFYIPNADWSALRDATIYSIVPDKRTDLYYSVLNTYKNYMQDARACIKFVGNWTKRPAYLESIARITLEKNFEPAVKVDVPLFRNLKENVNYADATRDLIITARNSKPRV